MNDLNAIKLLGKEDLLKILKQSGYNDVVAIIEDREIDGERFINLVEFEIFKWRLSSDEKKCLWNCITEIKAKPSLLAFSNNPKIERSTSLSEPTFPFNAKASKKLGKIKGFLKTIGTSLSLPNQYEPVLPPKTCASRLNEPNGAIKKNSLPFPHLYWDGYVKMAPPKRTENRDDDDNGYLTPTELEETDYEAPPNLLNTNSFPSNMNKNLINKSVPPRSQLHKNTPNDVECLTVGKAHEDTYESPPTTLSNPPYYFAPKPRPKLADDKSNWMETNDEKRKYLHLTRNNSGSTENKKYNQNDNEYTHLLLFCDENKRKTNNDSFIRKVFEKQKLKNPSAGIENDDLFSNPQDYMKMTPPKKEAELTFANNDQLYENSVKDTENNAWRMNPQNTYYVSGELGNEEHIYENIKTTTPYAPNIQFSDNDSSINCGADFNCAGTTDNTSDIQQTSMQDSLVSALARALKARDPPLLRKENQNPGVSNNDGWPSSNSQESLLSVSHIDDANGNDHSIFNVNDNKFYRNTTRKGVKMLLLGLEDGAFLFRPSATFFLSLSIIYEKRIYNFGIDKVGDEIQINNDSTSPKFRTLTEFVDYFTKEPITFIHKNVIKKIILKPVLIPN